MSQQVSVLSNLPPGSRRQAPAVFQVHRQLIAATTTTTGLTVRAELDENKYPKSIKISDAKLAVINLVRHPFHGDWSYAIYYA